MKKGYWLRHGVRKH